MDRIERFIPLIQFLEALPSEAAKNLIQSPCFGPNGLEFFKERNKPSTLTKEIPGPGGTQALRRRARGWRSTGPQSQAPGPSARKHRAHSCRAGASHTWLRLKFKDTPSSFLPTVLSLVLFMPEILTGQIMVIFFMWLLLGSRMGGLWIRSLRLNKVTELRVKMYNDPHYSLRVS